MGRDTKCVKIDDWSFKFIRGDISIVVTINDGIVCVINPNVDIDGCPLIIHAECGRGETFAIAIVNILRGYRDEYFTTDVNVHMHDVIVKSDNDPIRNVFMTTAKGVRDRLRDCEKLENRISNAVNIMGG